MNIEETPDGRYNLTGLSLQEFATLQAVMESIKDEYSFAPCDDPRVHRMHTLVFMFWAELEVFRKETVRAAIGETLRLNRGALTRA